MHRSLPFISLILGIALSTAPGCNASGSGSIGFGQPRPGEPENPAPPVSALDDPAHPGIETCTGGLSSAEIEAELDMARAFEDSLHEMIICGGLSASYSVSFVDVLINAALGASTNPAGFAYLGRGIYDAGGNMTISLHLPYATSFGRVGDVIPFDVFAPANYFADLTVVATATVDLFGNTTTELQIEFSEAGPGFELLGLAAVSGDRITVRFDDIVAALGEILVRTSFVVTNNQRDGVTVQYLMENVVDVTVADLIYGGSLPMELVDVVARRAGSSQRIEVTRGLAPGPCWWKGARSWSISTSASWARPS
jgi:hypothetical protein